MYKCIKCGKTTYTEQGREHYAIGGMCKGEWVKVKDSRVKKIKLFLKF